MYTKYRSFGMFKLTGIIGGVMLLAISAMGINAGIKKGLPAGGWAAFIFVGALGLALLVSMIIMQFHLGNTNAGKADESIRVSYGLTYRGNTQMLEDISVLSGLLASLASGEEISIHLNPEYLGLMDWKFLKIKNWYISFVWIRKKDKTTQYFIMPQTDLRSALSPFNEVFAGHKAVDTSKLISMKRYQAVLDFYKLK